MKQILSIMNWRIVISIFVFVLLVALQNTSGFDAFEIRDDDGNMKGQTVGLFMSDTETFNGYTLFNPVTFTTTYLINNNGDVIHTWDSDYEPNNAVYLLENGDLLRSTYFSGSEVGGFQKLAWDGTVICEFEYSGQHHDIAALPNGNILMVVRDTYTRAEAIAAGRDPNLLDDNRLRPLAIVEAEPNSASGADIVWEWHLWDHLIQDYDPTKDNYGVVADHPELVDINFAKDGRAGWVHANSIDYNEEFDQIIVSSRNLNEIWVIDHSTKTTEAANHTGGNSGKGGDLLYRWGNPQSYRAGNANDQQLFGQHDAQWIKSGCPGAGNILIFNNGLERYYSSVDEIVPPVDGNGNYSLILGSSYEPEEPIWIYTDENPPDFYAAKISGAQRLPNGNTLVCDGDGIFFEVTLEKEIVWEYVNPYPNPGENNVFKIRRYYPPSIEPIPTLHPIEEVLYILNLSSMITDHDTPDENLMLTENSSYADLVGFELHLLYPKGVIYDIINFSVSDGMFTVYQDIQVEVKGIADFVYVDDDADPRI